MHLSVYFTSQPKWYAGLGRPKKQLWKYVKNRKKVLECMVFHSVTARDLDDSDLEAYGNLYDFLTGSNLFCYVYNVPHYWLLLSLPYFA